MPRNQKAGEAIAAGGYGCVFKPPIRCKNKEAEYDPTGVSKLMISEFAIDEMNEIKKIKPIISSIPNNDLYFLVSKINICKPNNLTEEDKKRFNETCSNLRSDGITSFNVNKNLDKLKILNIPYGGKELNDYKKDLMTNLMQNKITERSFFTSFAYTNFSMIDLLENGILPMNKRGLYHCDIKASNILRDGDISDTTPKVRLIDWGLSFVYNPNEWKNKKLPHTTSVIQFNVPFSNILFNSEVSAIINTKLLNIENKFSFVENDELGRKEIMKAVAINILGYNFNKRGEGHRRYVEELLTNMYHSLLSNIDPKINLSKHLETIFNTGIIVDYLAEVLYYYTKRDNLGNYIFMYKEYFEKVYLKNVDIWGFLMSYIIFIELKPDGADWNDKLTNSIMRILLEYCFNPKYAVKPIPVNDIIYNLKSLNTKNVLGFDIKKEKICPPGKELNIKTGRCVNIKKPKTIKKPKQITSLTKTKKIILKPEKTRSKEKSNRLSIKKVESIPREIKEKAFRNIILNQPFSWPVSRKCPRGFTGVKSKSLTKKVCVPKK